MSDYSLKEYRHITSGFGLYNDNAGSYSGTKMNDKQIQAKCDKIQKQFSQKKKQMLAKIKKLPRYEKIDET